MLDPGATRFGPGFLQREDHYSALRMLGRLDRMAATLGEGEAEIGFEALLDRLDPAGAGPLEADKVDESRQ